MSPQIAACRLTRPAADNPPEDSFYLWGPPVPLDFITNQEVAAPA